MVTQATSPTLTPKVFAVIRNTIAKAFPLVVPYITYVRSYNGLWGFVIGSKGPNPAELTAEQVNKIISERLEGTLKFYDGETHEWMFHLPKPLRKTLEEVEDYATDSNPTYVPV